MVKQSLPLTILFEWPPAPAGSVLVRGSLAESRFRFGSKFAAKVPAAFQKEAGRNLAAKRLATLIGLQERRQSCCCRELSRRVQLEHTHTHFSVTRLLLTDTQSTLFKFKLYSFLSSLQLYLIALEKNLFIIFFIIIIPPWRFWCYKTIMDDMNETFKLDATSESLKEKTNPYVIGNRYIVQIFKKIQFNNFLNQQSPFVLRTWPYHLII